METFVQPKVTGYRQLNEQEAALMNEIKALGSQLDGMARKVSAHLSAQVVQIAFQREDMLTFGLESRPYSGAACAEARPGEGLMFPDPGTTSLVVAERIQAGHQKAACAVGAKARVNFKKPAGGRLGVEKSHQSLRQARIYFAGPLVTVVMNEDQVKVRGVPQLLAPKLAVGDDREFRGLTMAPASQLPALGKSEFEGAIGEF